MKLTRINSAEAIFEAFYDPQRSQLAAWTVDQNAASGFRIWQNWIWVQWNWEKPGVDGLNLRLSRPLDLACAGYDRLLACVTAPQGARVTLVAQTDRGERRRTGEAFGTSKREEWLPLDGATRLTALAIEVHAADAHAGTGWLLWLGLQSTDRLPHHLAQWTGYDARWAEHLQPEDFSPTFQPRYGLWITGEELEQARKDFAGTTTAGAIRAAGAEAVANTPPEQLIGENVNWVNSYVARRERDYGRFIFLHGPAAAQAGLFFKDAKLARLGARYALALAHCTTWEDTFMARMPGSAWEMKAFMPSYAAYELALLLDLVGEWFTPLARELILRRIAEEGHGSVNFNAWFWEYIFHCNQLAWFSSGRIYGYLVLERETPLRRDAHHPTRDESRVKPYTDLAVAELQDSLGKIILPDGGYVEGPSYFTWTVRQAFLCFQLYARARGDRKLEELMPPGVKQTARLAEMLCSTADHLDMLPIGDTMYVPPESLPYLAWYMPDSHWVTIYRKQMARAGGATGLNLLPLARAIPAHGPELSPFLEMRDTAMMCSVRRLDGELVKIFVKGAVAGAGHSHEDAGSFILEFAGDSFAMDFGVIDYASPIGDELSHAQRHNLLAPSHAGGERPRPRNPSAVDARAEGHGDEQSFFAKMSPGTAWPDWFSRWERTWDSPLPHTLVLTDEWAVNKGDGACFYWTTPLPMALSPDGRTVSIEGRRGRVELTLPDGAETRLEYLPLVNPAQRALDRQRAEFVRFGIDHAETQPRLCVRQRGRSGTLRVTVQLQLRPGRPMA